MRRTRSGFSNLAADKIWNDHIGNNEYTRHRDQCSTCLAAFRAADPTRRCSDGVRIFGEMLARVDAEIHEVLLNQN